MRSCSIPERKSSSVELKRTWDAQLPVGGGPMESPESYALACFVRMVLDKVFFLNFVNYQYSPFFRNRPGRKNLSNRKVSLRLKIRTIGTDKRITT
jgi:hypothetical protein